MLRKQRTGEYIPQPKGCGGCIEVKRRVDVVQFVYPYWHGGANGDELKYSVRSVEKNFMGRAHITLVGDRPPWFKGHVIQQQRVGRHMPNRAFRDMLAKMWTIATHPEIHDDFIWMMDDIYLIKPVGLEDLATPRAEKWSGQADNSWQVRKQNTMRVLSDNGYQTNDYATHLPHHAEKQKLREMYQRFDLAQNTLLWEVLYGNIYRGTPQRSRPFLARVQKRSDTAGYFKMTGTASVFNHTESAWCEGLRNFLDKLFPEPASNEIEGVPFVPRFTKTRKANPNVKRRPRHTHRAVIEARGK